MAADNISNILDPQVLPDLQLLIDKLVNVEDEIKAITGKVVTVTVDLKGVDSISTLTAAIQKQEDTIEKLNQTLSDNKAATAQLNTVTNTYGQTVGSVTNEVGNLQNRLSGLQALLKQATPGSQGWKDLNTQISATSQKLSALTPQLKEVGAAANTTAIQINQTSRSFNVLGISGDNVERIFARMIIRIAAFQLLFDPIIAGVTALATAFYDAIPGTDGYIKKQKELQDTLVNTESEFTSAIEKADEFKKSIDNALGAGEDQYKSQIDQAKALGVVLGGVYENELKQFKATQALRDKQISDLDTLALKYDKLNTIFHEIDKGADLGRVRNEIKNLGLSDEDYKKYVQMLNEFLEARKNHPELKLYGNETITKAQADVTSKSNLTAQQKIDEQTAFDSANDKRNYDKHLELTKQLETTNEQLRQANEKEDIESIDKIVNDTRAKYALLADDIKRNRETYRLSMTTKDDVKYTDDNTKAYDKLLYTLGKIGKQEETNSKFEFKKKRGLFSFSATAQESETTAKQSQIDSDYGIPDYDKMAKAQDDQKNAAINTESARFSTQIEQYKQYGFNTEEITREHEKALQQIESESYQKRVVLAGEYFSKIAEQITQSSAILASQDNNASIKKMIALQQSGHSSGYRDRHRDILELQQQKQQAADAQREGKLKLPNAQAAYEKSSNSAVNATSTDDTAVASKQAAADLKNVTDIQGQIDAAKLQGLDVDKQIADKKRAIEEEIRDTAIQLAQETAQAITTIQDNQFAKQQQQLEIQMTELQNANQIKVAAINATTGYQITKDNELAKQAAQYTAQQNAIQQQENQLALKKAKFDKASAEASVILNTAVAITKILASDAYNPAEAAVLIALTTAIGAAQYAAAASTPLPQFYLGGTTQTPIFSAGERGPELITTPGGQSFLSNPTATIYKAPIGTKITPAEETAKLIRFASANIGISGYDAAFMQQPMNNKDVVSGLDKLGDRVEDVVGDLAKVQVMLASRQNPNSNKKIVDEMRSQKKLR